MAATVLTPAQELAFSNLLLPIFRTNAGNIITSLQEGNTTFADTFGTYLPHWTDVQPSKGFLGFGATPEVPDQISVPTKVINCIRTPGSGRRDCVPVTRIGAGADGTIFTETSSTAETIRADADSLMMKEQDPAFIWKMVAVRNTAELRDVFMEAFALAVLGADPDFTQTTCGILGLYKPLTFALVNHTITYPPDGFQFFMKMRKYYTIEVVTKNPTYGYYEVRPIIQAASTTLVALLNKYSFIHSDLHVGNIMFQTNGTPVLIDFGRAGFSIGDTRYATSGYAVRTAEHPDLGWSYDMLIYIVSVMRHCSVNRDMDSFRELLVYNRIDILQTLRNQGVNPLWYAAYSFHLWRNRASGLVGLTTAGAHPVIPTNAQIIAFTQHIVEKSARTFIVAAFNGAKYIWNSTLLTPVRWPVCQVVDGVKRCFRPKRTIRQRKRTQPNKRQTRRFRSHRRS